MIFVTVGTQLPFPRLLDAMNAFADLSGETVIAQARSGAARWPNLVVHDHMAPDDFDKTFRAARLIVGHAGIGTFLSARQHQKPLVVLPRRHDLGEHRNDHQMATARRLERVPGVRVVWDAADLPEALTADLPPVAAHATGAERDRLIARLRGFIDD